MKAYEVINSESKWTRGVLARDIDGTQCSYRSEYAVRFCASGAISRAYAPGKDFTNTDSVRAREILVSAVGNIGGWNDTSDWKTVYDTLRRLDI